MWKAHSKDNYVFFLDSFREKKEVNYFDIVHVLNAASVHYYEQNYPTVQLYNRHPYKHIEPKIPLFVPPKRVEINISINSIQDIIDILDKYPYHSGTEYNIDLKNFHKIRNELVQLNSMVGLTSLKNSVVNQLIYFIQEPILCEKNRGYKHTILCGPPGTGKTEIAKIIGNMYSKLGVLSKRDSKGGNTSQTDNVLGDAEEQPGWKPDKTDETGSNKFPFKKVTRSDLIAGYLGQTALKTRGVIKECLGGCLFIDEAYSLGNPGNIDIFSRECVDTLCEALSDHKDELMVIIAGYEHELKEQFFSMNPGLESRFVWKFNIEKYTSEELCEIFRRKVTEEGWQLDVVNIETWFEKHQADFKHHGRDIEQLLLHTKIIHAKRIYGKSRDLSKKITIEDLDNGRNIFLENQQNPKKMPESLYGLYT